MFALKLFAVLLIVSGIVIAQQQPTPPQQGIEPDMGLIPTQSRTYKNFPTPEEVLVVYANNSIGDSSRYIAEYYKTIRNIPEENIVPEGLFIPSSITYPEGTAELRPGGEDIWGNGNLGWWYVRDTIATPIERYLNNTYVNGQPLKNRINYIVLCKGIPLKVRTLPFDTISTYRKQASVSALLCLMDQPDTNKHFLQLYGSYMTTQLNPYFGVDPSLTMDYRFQVKSFC